MTAPASDRRPALAALALGSLAMIVTGLQPLLLSELADAGRLSHALVHPTAIVELLAMALSVAVCALFLKPERLNRWAAGGAVVCILAGLGALVARDSQFLLVRGLSGLAGGVLIWITVGMIARRQRPEPWAAAFFLIQSAGQVFAAGLASALGPTGGVALAAGLSGLCLLAAPLLGPAMEDLARAGGRGPDRRGLLGLTALFLYFAANSALWFKMRDLAAGQGLEAVSGLVVLTTLGAQMLGAMAAVSLAGRLSLRQLFALVVICLLLACATLAFRPPAPVFVAAFGLLAFAALLLGASLFGFLHGADPSRRAGAVSPAAQFLAAALGPLAGVAVADLAGLAAVLALSPVLALAALGCAHFSLPKGGPASPDCA
ncbi:MAG: transporter [Caulobacter sp.]|nr:transporter [Caulobacter sp.]